MWARIKPHDKARGHVLRRNHISGITFFAGVWKKFDVSKPNNARLLETLALETMEVLGGPLAFDIVDQAGLAAIKRQEKLAKYGQLPNEEAPARPQPPPDAEASPTTVNDPEPTHVVELPPAVVREEADWAASRAAAEEEAQDPPPPPAASKRAAPKKKAAKKKAASKKKR
jgi:hypothetical protein